ncbi:MAG: porin family protein [Alphaproteobacteria bacterium]|nr:porin family protein [Alphaproteobacteria bacterium]
MKKSLAVAFAAMAMLWPFTASASSPCLKGSFHGFYSGVSIGYADHDADQYPLGEPKQSSDDSGVIVGGHIGYNHQCEDILYGIEGDLSYVDLSTYATDPGGASFRSELDTFATLRARLGWEVFDKTLIYVTAGVAWADRTHYLNDPNAPIQGGFSQSDSDFDVGWVVGGGIEFLRHENWMIRTEVLWADLGSENRRYTLTGCGLICETRVKWDDEILTARVALSYRFGAREVYHEPLK